MKRFLIRIIIIISLILVINCENNKEFNSLEWKEWKETENSLNTRWLMCKDLLKKYNLKKYNKKQIIILLGRPDYQDNYIFKYNLGYVGSGIDTGTLIITFKNNLVNKIEIIKG